tara:strand:+ start:796 stop:2097 length:1302 start_codon:yes stop_codon:yes gene_type:complete
MTVVTSKISPVTIGQGRNKETIYTATRTTKLADGTYDVEMLQYSNAQGQGGRVIAERDGVNNWNFNSQASNKVKQNEGRLNAASKNQMESMRGDFVKESQEAEAYNAAQGNRNKATNDNDGASTRPAAPRPAAQAPEGPRAGEPEKSAEGTRTQFPTIIHPADLGTSKQDVIRFDMHEYVPGELTQAGAGLGFNSGTNNLGPSIGSVTLPIPSGITDQNKADWGSNSMTALDIAKADVAKTAIFDGLQSGAEKFLDYIEKAKSNSGAVGSAVGNAFAAAAAGVDGQALLARTTGMVMNPNMELLFKGPTLRPFSFKFKLSPRGQTEADNIIQIIRFFKQGSAPIRSESNLFLKSPHVFRITYIHRGEQGELHKKLNAFKTCALQGFGVNYTPTGNYATYQDGTMVAYDINMSFTEITPIFNDDYDMDDTFIGF